jgi:hypothetical protein
MWHVYVAVVDGNQTRIRVDGMEEEIQLNHRQEKEEAPATIDGLTIGSDHNFGLTLCCGYGSGGEGEGAIAELAVFQGRLDDADICAMEEQLMSKHGIPRQSRPPQDVWQEDEWRRQAHDLYVRKNRAVARMTVPLRYMARHRAVAWKQHSVVTGDQIPTLKIGCRNATVGTSSSEF